MERSPICPKCLSKDPLIRGLIYTMGDRVGKQCEDLFHCRSDYNPDRWDLTAYDEEFLSEQHISVS